MYKLPYFQEQDAATIKEFIKDHPFVCLTGVDQEQRPVATQVPVLPEWKEDELFLYGHMMRQTDHHKAFSQNPHALALFTGAHCYVSASWYSNPAQGSTWNYMTVHARGKIRFLEESELREILRKTTAHFEGNPRSGANYEDLSEAYISKLVPAIAGFEMKVTRLDNVFKLSQNRDEASYKNIIRQLRDGNEAARSIASEMEKREAWTK
ncbi:MAG: FMN-binding negative transcriptional regulator [Chitinophagaceae bacterium]